MVQAICQAWNQCRINVKGRSGPLHQDIAATLNEYTWEGNNWRIDAQILDVFYPYNTSTHSLALIPLLGIGAENKIFPTYESRAQDLCYADVCNGRNQC